MKKIVFSKTQKITLFVLFFLIAAVLISYINSLYARRPMTFTSDAAYSWPKKSVQMDEWTYVELVTGHNYYLYLPEKYRNDKDNEDVRLPLIVAFHGSYEKGAAISRVGKRFISPDFQKKINSQGCAVLVPMSRMDFFSDPHSMSLLIQNVCLKNRCIDKSDIIAFGFSQGAKFAVELACAKSVITRIDLDGPVLCSEDPVIGGAVFDEKRIRVSNAPGLGIQGVREGYLKEI